MKLKVFTLMVVGVRAETDDTATIVFKQPGLKKIKYQAGQYLTLIFRINGRRYIRPYSFSSAPVVDSNLEVTVKRVPGGIVSNHIIDQVKINDVVEVMEPMGDFTIGDDKILPSRHIVLWGAGSGITPLMSIAKYALNRNTGAHVTLVYGNRNTDSVIFSNQIDNLKVAYPNKFSAWHFFTQLVIAPNNPYLIQGRIDPAKVLSVMQTEGELANTTHFICGPTGLKESVKTALSDLGISQDNIFSEDFEVVRDPADFIDISTQVIAITKNNETFFVEVVKGKSILEAGLDANIEMAYSCQTGNCLVCKGRLVKGQVKTIGVTNLPDGLQADEYLLCSSFPVTGDVEIEVYE